jgi:hypothetical protein
MNVRNFTGALIAIAALAVTACTSTSDGLELKLEDDAREVVATRHQDQGTTAYSTEQLIHLHNEN